MNGLFARAAAVVCLFFALDGFTQVINATLSGTVTDATGALIPGVEIVLDRQLQSSHGIDHARAGELVLIAAPRRWFSYDYWLDDDRAPDFARTVDIHRKPGYDPLELFLNPAIGMPKFTIASSSRALSP